MRRPVPAVPQRHLVIDNPYVTGGSWYKGNVQVASVRGIGQDLPAAIGRWYAAHGYAFLGISDQNTYTWTSEYGATSLTPLAVVDASYPFGDVLAVGDNRWLPAADLQGAVDWIARDNALPVLATPLSMTKPIDPRSLSRLKRLFGLEIYDARLAAGANGDWTNLWDSLLTAGQRVYAFAADDALSVSDAGRAWIEVQSRAPDAGSLMSSLRAGAFYASIGASFEQITVNGPQITVQAASGDTLRFIGRNGRLLKTLSGPTGSYTVSGNEGYVRIEAIGDDGGRAWSQPLFLTWR